MRKEPPGGEELAVAAPHCYCGRLARLQTSWTESNPLRRFFVCPKSELVKAETNLVVQTGRLVQTKQLQTLVQTEKLEMVVQTEMLKMVELVDEMVVELG
ncbi:hypothetical protein ACE6H2_001717 [Prunus campanulata]